MQKDSKTERAKKTRNKKKNTHKDPTTADNLMFSELWYDQKVLHGFEFHYKCDIANWGSGWSCTKFKIIIFFGELKN
jgi:hypothetical protein